MIVDDFVFDDFWWFWLFSMIFDDFWWFFMISKQIVVIYFVTIMSEFHEILKLLHFKKCYFSIWHCLHIFEKQHLCACFTKVEKTLLGYNSFSHTSTGFLIWSTVGGYINLVTQYSGQQVLCSFLEQSTQLARMAGCRRNIDCLQSSDLNSQHVRKIISFVTAQNFTFYHIYANVS